MLGDLAFRRVKDLDFGNKVLDIGGGDGHHALNFAALGKRVTLVDIDRPNLNNENIQEVICPFDKAYVGEFDLVWICHCLEHQPDPQTFLRKAIHKHLKKDGYLVIIVPPAKHQIVSGHVSLWNAGLVMYHLVLAGLDCSEARILSKDYNISVIVKKKRIELPSLYWDYGDLTLLKEFFPDGLSWGHDSFDGDIKMLNWF